MNKKECDFMKPVKLKPAIKITYGAERNSAPYMVKKQIFTCLLKAGSLAVIEMA